MKRSENLKIEDQDWWRDSRRGYMSQKGSLLPNYSGHNYKISLNFFKRNLEERIAILEASFKTLGKQVQKESDSSGNDSVLLHGVIKANISTLLDDLFSLKHEITQLRVAIKVQTQVLVKQTLTM